MAGDLVLLVSLLNNEFNINTKLDEDLTCQGRSFDAVGILVLS